MTTGNLSHQELEAEVERLWLREAFFDASQKLAKLGYCEWDYDNGHIISCTPAYAGIFGMSIEEVIESQNSWEKVLMQIHPEDRDHYTRSYRQHMAQGSHEVEYRIFRKDGVIRHLKEVAIMRLDRDLERKEAIGLVQDVTDQAMMRKEIEDNAKKLKLAARTAKLGYWHFDEVANEYIDISEEYAAIFGYTVPEFLEQFRTLDEDMSIVHPDDSDALYEAYETLEGKIDCSYRIQHRDGHWIHVREISTDITDENGNCIESIGTLQDVTELTEAQLRAEQANRAKNQFLSRMSHELRTPLNAILGFSQLIQSDSRLDERQQSRATTIFNAGQHLLSLIEEVLDLSRLEGGDIDISIEPVSLAESIGECLDIVADMAKQRGVTFDCDLDSLQGTAVEADAIRLRQVFINLLSNAVKYNREKGKVRVFCTSEGQGLLRVSVADEGPGIPPERIDELFEPFNRLGAESSGVEGTGIGLLISRQLIELMQGDLTVESNPGEGSTFSVRLRVSETQDIGMDLPEAKPGSTGYPSFEESVAIPRILVAEDNDVNQELVAAQLEYLGYCADYASDGVEALALWRAGDYPLLLTDIRMPGMDGIELISRIRELESTSPGKPIIAATASAMQADVQQCLDAGADDVISKPLVLDALKQVLDRWMPQTLTGTGGTSGAESSAGQDAPTEAIDVSLLRQSVGDRIDFQRRLLKTYAEALPKNLFDIRQAFAWHNLEQLGGFAHKLKSSSISLGATQIAQICNTLESACREQREAEIATCLAQLQQAAEPVEVFVTAFCGEPGEATTEAIQHGEIDDPTAVAVSVLLVDDDPIMHRITGLVLNDLGIRRVQSASSGQRALEIIGSQQDAIDIVVCDLNMPGMDGIELVRHLAERNFPGSLILMSGEDMRILRTVEKLAIEHGLQVLGVLEKPVTAAKMKRLLDDFNRDDTNSTIWPSQAITAEQLSRAIEENQLETYFQPKVDVKSGYVVGAEALVRWIHPERGIISPELFIPVAEEHGLIQDLTREVCRRALRHAHDWQGRGIDLDVALNISVDALSDLDWPNMLASEVETLGLLPASITLEITESRLMEHIRLALDILGRLSLKRFTLSIDDFGTGYSSMEQLQRIPFSELKIDRAFVRGANDDASARAILESSVLLARKLDMKVVAEGVETEQDWRLVSDLGCDYVQGYYIAKPMPAEQLCDWLAKQKIRSGR